MRGRPSFVTHAASEPFEPVPPIDTRAYRHPGNRLIPSRRAQVHLEIHPALAGSPLDSNVAGHIPGARRAAPSTTAFD